LSGGLLGEAGNRLTWETVAEWMKFLEGFKFETAAEKTGFPASEVTETAAGASTRCSGNWDQRTSERERLCVCVFERGREKVERKYVCVCVCVYQREKMYERERERKYLSV